MPFSRAYLLNPHVLLSVCIIVMWHAHALPASAQSAGLGALARAEIEGPVMVLDLVSFNEEGEKHYDRYDELGEIKLRSLGGKVVFRGQRIDAGDLPESAISTSAENSLSGSPRANPWDRATLRWYPSKTVVLQLAISREYQQALQHRIQGVDRSLVHAFSVEPLPDRPGKEPPRRRKIDSPSEDSSGSIYLLQLLKNESASATTAHPTGADPLQSGSIEAPLLSGTGITPVIGEETFEALRLTQYESGSLEGALNASASGKAVNLFWRGRFTKE